jgi:hypothetical protein
MDTGHIFNSVSAITHGSASLQVKAKDAKSPGVQYGATSMSKIVAPTAANSVGLFSRCRLPRVVMGHEMTSVLVHCQHKRKMYNVVT